jgi:hypothetical protein
MQCGDGQNPGALGVQSIAGVGRYIQRHETDRASIYIKAMRGMRNWRRAMQEVAVRGQKVTHAESAASSHSLAWPRLATKGQARGRNFTHSLFQGDQSCTVVKLNNGRSCHAISFCGRYAGGDGWIYRDQMFVPPGTTSNLAMDTECAIPSRPYARRPPSNPRGCDQVDVRLLAFRAGSIVAVAKEAIAVILHALFIKS